MVAMLFLLVLAVAVIWKFAQLARDPKNGPLRSVTLCLLTAALSYPLAMPGGADGVDTVAGSGAAKVLQNILLLGTVYFLMSFYLFSAEGRAARLRARWEGVTVGVVAIGIAVIAATAPRRSFAGASSTAHMSVWQVAVFYIAAGLYMMYALAVAAWWSRSYARASRRPLSTGLWMVAIGLAAMSAACAVRAVSEAIQWAGGSVPKALLAVAAFLLQIAIMLFVVGVSYPVVRNRITDALRWNQHRRDHHRLRPLWELLAEAFPENILKPAAPTLRDRWRAHGVHRRYHRRIVECRDGLVDISPYLAIGTEQDSALHLDTPELAVRLRQAVSAIERAVPAPRPAVALAVPGEGGGRDADVRQLIAVAEALRQAA